MCFTLDLHRRAAFHVLRTGMRALACNGLVATEGARDVMEAAKPDVMPGCNGSHAEGGGAHACLCIRLVLVCFRCEAKTPAAAAELTQTRR